MANAGDALDMAQLGCRVQLIRTAADTGGELLEFDVLGRPRGFLVQSHVHTGQVERYEVTAGTLKIVEQGRVHLLDPGETMEVPAAMSACRSARRAARRRSSGAPPPCAQRASSTASASPSPSPAPGWSATSAPKAMPRTRRCACSGRWRRRSSGSRG